jgi:hypothetical protein
MKLKWCAPLVAVLSIACGSSPTTPSPRDDGGLPSPAQPATFLAAGDIGWCGLPGADLTARILDRVSGTVLALGDLAYPNGTFLDFARCYGPNWGRHRDRTRPTPGNHDYDTLNGVAYYAFFEELAGAAGEGYFSYTAGGWHIISLNSNIAMAPGSAQYGWLQQELSHPSRCTLAYWHHPLFSSGVNGDNPNTRPLWNLLYAAGAEVVLTAHDHVYERYVPQTPEGQPDRDRGMRQFIVGTGGGQLTSFAARRPNSAVTHVGHGVLKLVLSPDRYEWDFIPVEGSSFTDAGFDMCH